MKNFMRRFRRLASLYAKLLGLFWLPCPICGDFFGGHERGGTLWDDKAKRSGSCLCWKHSGDYFAKPEASK